MQKRAHGPRPAYFSDPALDTFLVMLMTLAEEVSVLRERLDSFERVAAERGAVTLEEIEEFAPAEDVAGEREAWRRAYLERLLRVVIEQGTAPGRGAVDEVVAAVSA